MSAEKVMLDALKAEARRLLAQCTEPQQAFFERAFPGGVDGLTLKTGKHAVEVCERTVAKNEKAGGTP